MASVKGVLFNLEEAVREEAVREDGSIKLCMVVHLYLSEPVLLGGRWG